MISGSAPQAEISFRRGGQGLRVAGVATLTRGNVYRVSMRFSGVATGVIRKPLKGCQGRGFNHG
jgi:hypothetical protein